MPDDSPRLGFPGRLARLRSGLAGGRARERGSSVDWARIGAWSLAVVFSLVVWAGIALAVLALLR